MRHRTSVFEVAGLRRLSQLARTRWTGRWKPFHSLGGIVMLAVMERRRRKPGSFGQTMTEFALVVPVLFILVLGVLDGGLLMFSVGTARYAAVEGAAQAAQLGNAAAADTQTLQVIRDRAGTDRLFSVDEIDIYKLNQDGNGNLTPDPTLSNRYAG